MHTVLESCYDTKVASTAADSPEQTRVGFGIGAHEFSICQDHLNSQEIVYRETILAN